MHPIRDKYVKLVLCVSMIHYINTLKVNHSLLLCGSSLLFVHRHTHNFLEDQRVLLLSQVRTVGLQRSVRSVVKISCAYPARRWIHLIKSEQCRRFRSPSRKDEINNYTLSTYTCMYINTYTY